MAATRTYIYEQTREIVLYNSFFFGVTTDELVVSYLQCKHNHNSLSTIIKYSFALYKKK
jgi:hypothetical protein